MKVAVAIPNWNGADMIGACLRSLNNQSYACEAIVVDNGSVDDSVATIEEQFPRVHLIKLPVNTGFAGGVNTGIQYAIEKGYDAVALLNNDATTDKDWLKNLVSTLQKDQHIGMVTSKIMRSDKKHIDSTGDFYSAWGTAFPRGRDEPDTGQFESVEEVFSASGGASLYRTAMFREVGLFDEDFFAYYEDVDISFRARLAGWKVFYQHNAVVYHEVGATSSRIHDFGTYHGLKNIFFLSYKNLPFGLLLVHFPKRLLYYTALHAYAWKQGKAMASLKACVQIVRLLPKKTIERWHIQKKRKLPVAELNRIIYPKLPPSTRRKLGAK